MPAHKRQAHLEAPVENIWELVGSPARFPEWWPRIVEVRGADGIEEGDEFPQVVKGPTGSHDTSQFLLERRDDLHEIRLSCQTTGMYSHFQLTPAQGGTFVELEMGMEPKSTGYSIFNQTAGRIYFSRWCEQTLAALREAAAEQPLG